MDIARVHAWPTPGGFEKPKAGRVIQKPVAHSDRPLLIDQQEIEVATRVRMAAVSLSLQAI
jgi:hypothetical protein